MSRAIIQAWHKYTPFGDELVVDNPPDMYYNLVMKYIELTKEKRALVDDSDFEWLNKFNWHYTKAGYAARGIRRRKLNWQGKIYMHREILKTDKKVDHINGDSLDNRRENLRIATHAENIRNGKIRTTNNSGFKGVHWDKERNKWQANIMLNYKKIFLGRFDTSQEAARVYNDAAIKYFKQFGRLNNI